MRTLALAVCAIAFVACGGAEGAEGFARFGVSVEAPADDIVSKDGPASGDMVNGIVELNASDGTACLTLGGLRFESASLTGGEQDIVFPRGASNAGNICVDATGADLQEVVDDPSGYRLAVDLSSGVTSGSELEQSR
ncbi:MAG: hypothetical protein QOG54_748 [Actinomycetota bacterium]|jgi:hypothetical protein|nr:hypothetical protein [Actinomycetota bacterium]